MTFQALVVKKNSQGEVSFAIERLDDDRLPPGNVTVAVEYTTVNYKDGLCMQPNNGLVREYPHVPGYTPRSRTTPTADSVRVRD